VFFDLFYDSIDKEMIHNAVFSKVDNAEGEQEPREGSKWPSCASTWKKLGHLMRQRSCLWSDESSFGLIKRTDSVYESRKNKQLNAAEGKAACCPPLPPLLHFSPEIQTGWMLCCSLQVGAVGVAYQAAELQPAIINNQPQNMSGLDLFVLFEVQTCWSNPSDGCKS